MRLRSLTLASLAALGLLLSACTAFTPAAAVVGDDAIEEEDFQTDLEFVLADPRFTDPAAGGGEQQQRQDLARQILSFLIQDLVIQEEARARGIEAEPGEVDALLEQQIQQIGGQEAFDQQLETSGATEREARDLLTAQILRDKVARAVVEDLVPEDELRAEYEDRLREFTQVDAAHILVRNESLASRIAREATPETFARLARRHSIDEGSASLGGELGNRPVTDFVEPFANGALEIPEGEVGGPVQSEFGFHVILVNSRTQIPFEEVRQQLLDERAGTVFRDWMLDRLRSETVRVNPRYGTFDPDLGEVVPRTATTPLPGPQVTP